MLLSSPPELFVSDQDPFASLTIPQFDHGTWPREAEIPNQQDAAFGNSAMSRIQQIIESPWSPAPCFLPARQRIEDFGNSAEPFRESSPNYQTRAERSARLRRISESQLNERLSDWSDLYHFSVPIPRLSKELQGFTILHLSDVHLLRNDSRPTEELSALSAALELRSLPIDLLIFTGDLITRLPDDLSKAGGRALRMLSDLAAHSFFVRGNHDFHGKVPHVISRFIEMAGFEDLTNRSASLTIGGSRLNIFGIDDAYFGTPQSPEQMPAHEINIVATHNLDSIRKSFPASVDLILSGHTHWGELKMPFSNFIKPLDGMWWMKKWGYADNVNGHTRHWDALSDRTLSFVHPGLARYYAPRALSHPPGFALHTLTSLDTQSQGIRRN